MKVLHVIGSLGRGGAEQALVNVLPSLRARGHQVHVASLFAPYDLAATLEDRGITTHLLGVNHRWNVPQAMVKLVSLASREKFDVLHGHLFFAGLYTGLTRPFVTRPKRVVTFLNLGYSSYPANTPWRRVRKRIDGFVTRNMIDGWTAVSRSAADHYAEHLHLATAPQVIPLAVSSDALQHGERAHLERYGAKPAECVIAFPARLVPEKGHRFVLEALEILRRHGVHAKILAFGSGPKEAEVRAEISRRGLGDCFLLLGPIPNRELLTVVRAADFVVLASTHEGFPVAAVEAMALGKALLATEVGGLRDLVASEKNGLLVPPADPEALAAGMERLITDLPLRERLGAAARTSVESTLTGEAVAKQLESYYETLLGHA